MPWLYVVPQALRPAARQPRTWRTRVAFAFLFAIVATWAAVAPQASLSMGERLRLSFHALTILCLILAATSALRHQTSIINDDALNLNWQSRALTRTFSNAF